MGTFGLPEVEEDSCIDRAAKELEFGGVFDQSVSVTPELRTRRILFAKSPRPREATHRRRSPPSISVKSVKMSILVVARIFSFDRLTQMLRDL